MCDLEEPEEPIRDCLTCVSLMKKRQALNRCLKGEDVESMMRI